MTSAERKKWGLRYVEIEEQRVISAVKEKQIRRIEEAQARALGALGALLATEIITGKEFDQWKERLLRLWDLL